MAKILIFLRDQILEWECFLLNKALTTFWIKKKSIRSRAHFVPKELYKLLGKQSYGHEVTKETARRGQVTVAHFLLTNSSCI